MLILQSTDSLTLVVAAAVTVHVTVSWVDLTGTTATTQVVTPDRKLTSIVGPATQTICLAPAVGYTRNIKFISARNTDAATATSVTLKQNDGSLNAEVKKLSVPADGELQFVDDLGFTVL